MTIQLPILVPTKKRTLSASQYLDDIKQRADVISQVSFIPPKIGSQGFGKFCVEYDMPILLPKSR